MGNPNEPHDADHQPTESFAQPPTPSQAPTTPPPAHQPARSWFTGSRRTGVLAGVAGLVIGGVIGGGIGWAATGNDHDDRGRNDSGYSRQLSAQGGQHQGGQQQGDQGQGQKRRTRGATIGTISAENGSSWTLATRNGRTVTVVIGPNTRFGTAKAPQQQSDFVVGDRIAVVGKDESGTIAATRVAKRVAKAGAAATPSGAAPSATTQPG